MLARVIGLELDAVPVDPDDLLEVARRSVELVVPARRAGVEIPDYWADAEEDWAKAVVAYEAGNVGVRLTLFAVLEEDGAIERFGFGGVGHVWAQTEAEVEAAARTAADAYRPMFWDDILEDETIEDVSEDHFDALPLAINLDSALRRELAREPSPREPPAPPKV